VPVVGKLKKGPAVQGAIAEKMIGKRAKLRRRELKPIQWRIQKQKKGSARGDEKKKQHHQQKRREIWGER